MLFENALYYPTIDIKDEAWLKSAVLLWDTISTIVPESEDEPYKNEWTRAFAQAGIVSPHKVNPYNVNFQGLGDEVKAYLNTTEGKRSFKPTVGKRGDYRSYNEIIREFQLSEAIWREYGDFKISAEKFGYGLQDVIRDFINDDGYVIASKAFMNFYMTSLANNICQQEDSKALLTDLTYTSDLTSTMMTNSPNKRMGEELLKQGVMYKLLISGLKIDPKTPVDKLIKFREDYKGERDLFKSEIGKLIQDNNVEGLPTSEVINQVDRIYRMKVLPSVNQLKRALDGRGIDYLENTGTNIMLTGISVLEPSGTGLATFGWKALKEIGLSILKKKVKINKEKEKILLGSPYSYLYRTQTYGFSRAGR